MVRRRSRKPKITGSNPVCAFFPLGFHQLLSSYAKKYIYPLIKTGSGEKTHSQGLVAQWITRLTTDQKIPGSNPGKVDLHLFHPRNLGKSNLTDFAALPFIWPHVGPVA